MADSEVQALKERLKYRQTICSRYKKSADDLQSEVRRLKIDLGNFAKRVRRFEIKSEKDKLKLSNFKVKVRNQSCEIKRMSVNITELEMQIDNAESTKSSLPIPTREDASYWKQLYFDELKRP